MQAARMEGEACMQTEACDIAFIGYATLLRGTLNSQTKTTATRSPRILLNATPPGGHPELQHVDIKPTFLHGVLTEEETIFMEQPQGFESLGKETDAPHEKHLRNAPSQPPMERDFSQGSRWGGVVSVSLVIGVSMSVAPRPE